MVFGNMGDDCSTGVAFTRNPSTGENTFFGEFLINAQGEDVVAGTRTPQYITKKAKQDSGSKDPSMEEAMPKVYKELTNIFLKLEKHYKDMQDIEFTVEKNKLWMLQTRSGKRTAKAAIKIAVDMVKEKLISKKEAIKRIDPKTLDTLLHPTLDDKVKKEKKINFPQDVKKQLLGAINAVFLSWDSQRAKTYRKLNQIPDYWGTAVNVQAMVFGNMGDECSTGVAFTRNPSTGENSFFGEFLINAQGEDVVAGTRTPQYILSLIHI